MNELLLPASNMLSFIGGFLFCFWILHKAKEKLLDVPKSSVTVQDIADWIKRKKKTEQLLDEAREMREKFLEG